MHKDWIKIMSISNQFKAEIIKGMLEENNIKVVLINKKDSAYGFGEVEIYVNEGHVLKALNLIKTNEIE
ncbi:MAG: hypothetical protein EA412_09435 [Chitinophagaceae bacterium]|nr:MAG: hypothetical protein EA412_09435 [Chitinophagaceae bacterium]